MICPHAPTPAPALIWWPGWLAIAPEALGAKKEEVLSHRGGCLGAPLSTQSKTAMEVTFLGSGVAAKGYPEGHRRGDLPGSHSKPL